MNKRNHHDKILNTALKIFHERGFHNSSTQDIVNLAGVSKGSFYNHFKSKDALGLAALDLYWENNEETRKLLRDSTVPALKRIDNHLKAIGYNKAGCLLGKFGSELADTESFRQLISELLTLWLTDVTKCLSDGQKDGTVRKDESAKNLAEFFISGLEGSIIKARVDCDPTVLERFRKSIGLLFQSQ